MDIVMTTYLPEGEIGLARKKYAVNTMYALDFWGVTDFADKFIIANDSEENSITELLYQDAKVYFDNKVVMQYGPHNGIGASLNRALAHVTDKWMYITDDWELVKSIDIQKAIDLLDTGNYDYVKLGPLHPDIRCVTKFDNNIGWYLELIWGRGFVFATRPFVATKQFYEYTGPFDEGLNAYETERLYCDRAYEQRYAALLSDGTEWLHIGEVEVGNINI